MKVSSLLLSTVMTVAHVVVALPSVHWFGDGDSCPQDLTITTYTERFGAKVFRSLLDTGTPDYDYLDADLADMNIRDHFGLLLRKYWLLPGRPAPGATLFLRSIFSGTGAVVPSNYAYLRYLLHKRPGNQQDVDDYLRENELNDAVEFYLKGPGDQEDAVDLLGRFLAYNKFTRLTALYEEDGRRDGIPHNTIGKADFDRVRTLLKNTGDQTTVESILRATLASSTIDHFESNIALVGRKIADTIKEIHSDIDWAVNKDRVDNYIKNNDKDGLSGAIRGSVNKDVRARVENNMDRIIGWRGYRSDFRGAIGKDAYIRFDFFLNGASDQTTLDDLLRVTLYPEDYQEVQIILDHAGDAVVVRDLFKTFDQATRDQLDSLLDPSGIPAAIDALCKQEFDQEEYEWIQEQIKETGDAKVLHQWLQYNETAYQQYLSLVNGNQEPVEKFLREKLASDSFDKLQSTLKETTDKVRYMVYRAKFLRDVVNRELRIDNNCYKFLRTLIRKELDGEKPPQQRLRLVIQH